MEYPDVRSLSIYLTVTIHLGYFGLKIGPKTGQWVLTKGLWDYIGPSSLPARRVNYV